MFLKYLQRWADRKMASRPFDFRIGEPEAPYMLRWWVLPRNKLFNIYLHRVLRSDDDRALHDHPWWNVSIIVRGAYDEHTIAAGGIHIRRRRSAGSVVLRRARAAHRLEVIPGVKAVTLFITGPRLREWGFHCVNRGWVLWTDFVDKSDKGNIGRGCGEQ